MSQIDTSISRRSFGRMLGVGAAAAVIPTAVLGARQAQAAIRWCRTDPLFLVGSKVIDVTIGSHLEMLTTATGPVQILLTTPVGVPVTHLVSDLGFGHGYDISYATDAALGGGSLNPQVRVSIMAPSSADLPVTLYYSRIGLLGQVELRSIEVDGRANAWISAE